MRPDRLEQVREAADLPAASPLERVSSPDG
jgi:hypothetical protein